MGVHDGVDTRLKGGQISGRGVTGFDQSHGILLAPYGRAGQHSWELLNNLTTHAGQALYDLVMLPTVIDGLDGRLIKTLAEAPRMGMLELARTLRVARGTAQAR